MIYKYKVEKFFLPLKEERDVLRLENLLALGLSKLIEL